MIIGLARLLNGMAKCPRRSTNPSAVVVDDNDNRI